jgi:hypothetical protein
MQPPCMEHAIADDKLPRTVCAPDKDEGFVDGLGCGLAVTAAKHRPNRCLWKWGKGEKRRKPPNMVCACNKKHGPGPDAGERGGRRLIIAGFLRGHRIPRDPPPFRDVDGT